MHTRYAHTNIVCEDWERLSRFYQAVFECEPVPPVRDQSGEWLSRGTGVTNASLRGVHLRLPGHGPDGPTLEIYQYGRIERNLPPAANRKGLGHLAFLVDDVAAARARVLAHGGGELGAITHALVEGVGAITFVYMTDPEGNVLEIQHWDP